ncbi:hypothetical protein, partial [Pseudomonas aeruginosa]|uniref:hypothetical protein n=1 Tax=Pseudomonas aeruginosa TaxID=287 RepID=UPI0012446620
SLEAGQHIFAPAQHPVTQLRPQTLAELRVAGETVAELFQRQLLKVALSTEERQQYDVLRLEDRPVFARLGALRRYLETVK